MRDLQRLEQLLEEIRADVKKLREEQSIGVAAVSVSGAARALNCSARHVSRLIRSGSLLTAPVGGLRRIPMSEIRRITSAPELGQRQEPLRRQPKYSAAMNEAEYLKLRGRGKPKKR